MQQEIWKPLPWYLKPKIRYYQQGEKPEQLFEISNLGRVKSYRYKPSRILNLSTNPNGYKYFQFRYNWKRVSLLTHRAVLLSFIWEPPTLKHQANHIDFDRWNNQLENLEWLTPKQNVDHSRDAWNYPPVTKWESHHFYNKTWKNHPKSIQINQLDMNKEIIKTWGSANLAALHLKWNRSHISRAIRRWGKAYWHFWEKA